MKKLIILFLIILCVYTPSILAHEQLDDGWHFVVKNAETERGKNWNDQAKEWGYYEDGKEILRYSKLLGSHRGWGEAPENSLAAFQMTRDKGYYLFETDVRFTKDNIAVLSHDDFINNVAKNNDLSDINGTIYIKDLTYSELKNNYIFNIERVNHSGPTVLAGYNGNRITSFEEMLNFVKRNKMYVSIELKEGTKEQIESLVKMTQEKNMHNHVRWISFYTDLLKYVRDYDGDESLGILTSSSCDQEHNLYCGEDNEYFHDKLKTDKNILWFTPYSSVYHPPAINCGINLPTDYDANLPTTFVGTPIPKGKITVTNSSEVLGIGQEKTISYQYDGDGAVKCKSDDIEQLTCSIDSNNHKVLLKSVGDNTNDVNVSIYATQGIQKSASDDTIIKVSLVENQVVKIPDTMKKYPKVFVIISLTIILIGVGIINYALNVRKNN